MTVAMAYVGTDAPRMSHLAVLTHYRSKAWLHQLFARVWRRCPGVEYASDYCVAFCPDDDRLREVVDELREAQQIGIAAAEEDAAAEGGKDRATPVPIIVESSTLTGLTNRYEFSARNEEVSATPAPLPKPDPEKTRAALRACGHSEPQIDAMLAAAAHEGADRRTWTRGLCTNV